jgi:hypothetical protein
MCVISFTKGSNRLGSELRDCGIRTPAAYRFLDGTLYPYQRVGLHVREEVAVDPRNVRAIGNAPVHGNEQSADAFRPRPWTVRVHEQSMTSFSPRPQEGPRMVRVGVLAMATTVHIRHRQGTQIVRRQTESRTINFRLLASNQSQVPILELAEDRRRR